MLNKDKKHIRTKRWKVKNPRKVQFEYLKYNCKRAGRAFTLSYEKFLEIVGLPCYYCGTVERISIDRVDNNLGYVEGNMVPCCKTCNWMKSDMPLSVFLEHIRRIYRYMGDCE